MGSRDNQANTHAIEPSATPSPEGSLDDQSPHPAAMVASPAPVQEEMQPRRPMPRPDDDAPRLFGWRRPTLPQIKPLMLLHMAWRVWRAEGLTGLRTAARYRRAYTQAMRNPAAAIRPVNPPPAISIVIPALNNLDDTRECVESMLKAACRHTFEIIVVDNASTDGTAKWLAETAATHPQLRFVRNATNAGFAGGINTGVHVARGRYLVIANNDIVVPDHWLDGLAEALDTSTNIGIVSPVTNCVGEGPQLAHEFRNVAPEQANEVSKFLASQRLPLRQIPDRLVFFCVMLKRDMYDLVGGLSGVYGLGNFEDDDLCLRARLAGFTMAVHPGVFVFHHGSKTFRTQKIPHAQLMRENREIFFERMAGFAGRLLPHSPRRHGVVHAPQVSVIVRTMDRPALLRMALSSLANQTLRDFQTVVVNDGGPDISSLLQEFEPFLDLKYIAHPHSLGRTTALNAGIRAASAPWITYLDDDDIVYPLHLETLLDAALADPQRRVVYADANRVLCHVDDRKETVICRAPIPSFEFDPNVLLTENRLPIMTALHSTACFEKVGMFDEKLDLLEDWDFWLRVSRQFPFHHVPRTTSEYRFRIDPSLKKSVTSRRAEAMAATEGIYQRYPVSEPCISRQRKIVLDAMRLQIQDIEKIEHTAEDHIKAGYLTVWRVAGFSPMDIRWDGLRA